MHGSSPLSIFSDIGVSGPRKTIVVQTCIGRKDATKLKCEKYGIGAPASWLCFPRRDFSSIIALQMACGNCIVRVETLRYWYHSGFEAVKQAQAARKNKRRWTKYRDTANRSSYVAACRPRNCRRRMKRACDAFSDESQSKLVVLLI